MTRSVSRHQTVPNKANSAKPALVLGLQINAQRRGFADLRR